MWNSPRSGGRTDIAAPNRELALALLRSPNTLAHRGIDRSGQAAIGFAEVLTARIFGGVQILRVQVLRVQVLRVQLLISFFIFVRFFIFRFFKLSAELYRLGR